MNFKNSFIRNTSFVGISRIIESIISYVIIVLISRYLGAEGLGQYSFIFAFVGIFFIFGDFGLSQLLIKDLSKDDSDIDNYMSNVLSLKVVLLAICFLLYFIMLFFINKNEMFLTLVLAGIAQIMLSSRLPFLNILRVKEKGKILSVAIIMERFLTLLFSFYTVAIMKNLTLFMVGFLISQIIRTVWLYIINKKFFNFKFKIDKKQIFSLIKKSYPFLFFINSQKFC